jgi:hypothetical protein
MATEMLAQLAQAYAGGAGATNPASAGYAFSLTDIARFEAAYTGAGAGHGPGFVGTARLDGPQPLAASSALQTSPLASLMGSPGIQALLHPLERINLDAQKLSKDTSFSAMSAGDMIMLTVRSHEFLFHCELTSNVANRTSDGIQQLFRQQS